MVEKYTSGMITKSATTVETIISQQPITDIPVTNVPETTNFRWQSPYSPRTPPTIEIPETNKFQTNWKSPHTLNIPSNTSGGETVNTDGSVLASTIHYGSYVVLAFFGALLCFGIYKLIKWFKNKKKEELINLNLFKIENKLQEGNIFIKNMTTKLTEQQISTRQMSKIYSIIEKARPLTKDLAAYTLEAEEKKDTEKSFLKRNIYRIVGLVAGFGSILVWCVNINKK